MGSVEVELLLVALSAMLSPTTLTFSVLALVLGERPLRTGVWFYMGALTATLAVGVAAAFVLGDVAASSSSTPKTWVSIVDIVAGLLVIVVVVRFLRGPANPERTASAIERMGQVASSPAIAIVAAGAMLANPGGFIPLALKDISQLNVSAAEYCLYWLAFALVSLLPLSIALLLLALAPEWTRRVLAGARVFLERRARLIGAAILIVLGVVLIRNGIAGLTG